MSVSLLLYAEERLLVILYEEEDLNHLHLSLPPHLFSL